ncbi:MAG TPA: glycosyltransferase family 4 protein [Acidimicrobiales bacterium]|nr:glycosyltransferase family 4 protein [Acidimicrobiales bacterium]
MNATRRDVELARRGPVDWDVAFYASFLDNGLAGFDVEPLDRGRRWSSRPVGARLQRARRALAGEAPAAPDYDVPPIPAPDQSDPGPPPWWRRQGRLAQAIDVVAPSGGVRGVLSHLRMPVSAARLPWLWSTNGVIPEIWNWRSGPERERVRDEHVRLHHDIGRRASLIACWTHYGADHLVEMAGIPAERVRTVVPPFGLSAAPTAARSEADEPAAVFIAGLARLKGLGLALEAHRRLGGFTLHVVGPPPPPQPPPGTLWHGPLPPSRAADLLAGSDLLLMPAVYETYGVTYLEAMRAGVPIVASALGTVTEVVGDAGVLVAPGQLDDLVPAVERVLGDPETRRKLADRGRQRYLDNFAPDVALRTWEPVFREAFG